MSDFTLTCCSTADLPASYFSEHEIPFACFHFTMDGKEYDDDLGKSMPFQEFYGKISQGALPTTSQVSIGQYIDLWEPYLEQGKDIIHITLSSGISGTYSSACSARDVLMIDYPDQAIHVIDSLGASSGYGLLVDAVCGMRDAGKGTDEVVEWIEANRLTVHHWFFSTDLTSYYRGGRISKSSMIIGNALNICPLLNMDDKGHLTPRTKFRGVKRVSEAIVKRMEEHAIGGLDYSGKCFISNSACIEDAKRIAHMVEERFKKLDGKVMINSVGTTIGAHTGPGTVALFFFGDLRAD